MDPDLWKKVDALLEEALAQPPDQREAFVTEASKDNAELRDEVLSLLKAQEQVANFMERFKPHHLLLAHWKRTR